MAVLYFHVEQRSAWVRTGTHTIVYDRDPAYPRFAKDPSGSVKHMLREYMSEEYQEPDLT